MPYFSTAEQEGFKNFIDVMPNFFKELRSLCIIVVCQLIHKTQVSAELLCVMEKSKTL